MIWTELLVLALLGTGLGFYAAGSLGLLRFPDTASRLHALTKAGRLRLKLHCSMQAAQGEVQRLARRQRYLPKGHLFGFDAQPGAAPCGRIAAFSGLLQIGDDLPLRRGKIRRQCPHAIQPNAIDGGLAPRFAGIIDRVVV